MDQSVNNRNSRDQTVIIKTSGTKSIIYGQRSNILGGQNWRLCHANVTLTLAVAAAARTCKCVWFQPRVDLMRRILGGTWGHVRHPIFMRLDAGASSWREKSCGVLKRHFWAISDLDRMQNLLTSYRKSLRWLRTWLLYHLLCPKQVTHHIFIQIYHTYTHTR